MSDIYLETIKGPWLIEPETDTQYRIEEDDSSITVTFQGSVSKLDWLQNLSFWKKPYKKMGNIFFVHAGFLKKYKAVREIIMDQVKEASFQGKHILIRGYSQGAALALLLHEDVWYDCQYLAQTIVFGCPRVFTIFNKKVLNRRMLNVVRYQNGNDAVTKLAPWWMLYKHYGVTKNIGKKRKVFRISVKDHLNYREVLKKENL